MADNLFWVGIAYHKISDCSKMLTFLGKVVTVMGGPMLPISYNNSYINVGFCEV